MDDDWEFRRQFGCAPAAQACVRADERLEAEHSKPANDLFSAARNENDEAEKKAMYKEIVDKDYASGWWILVKDWAR